MAILRASPQQIYLIRLFQADLAYMCDLRADQDPVDVAFIAVPRRDIAYLQGILSSTLGREGQLGDGALQVRDGMPVGGDGGRMFFNIGEHVVPTSVGQGNLRNDRGGDVRGVSISKVIRCPALTDIR